MRSCVCAITLLLLSHPAWSQESRSAATPAMQARDLVWLEPCPRADDASDVEALNARIDCLERRSEAMADSQHLLLQGMLRLLEEQFLNEPAKIVERIPAVANEAELFRLSTSGRRQSIPERRDSFRRVIARATTREVNYRGFLSVINCVPPLADKSGFVLIGAKLSNWKTPEGTGGAVTNKCMGRDVSWSFEPLGSRSRSEGCYVNRTWFDWYTRRAAAEGWPTDEATLCQESAEE